MNCVRIMTGICAIALASVPAQAADDPALARDILIKSLAYRTVAGEGQVPRLAAYYAQVLQLAGFAPADIEIKPYGETATLAVTLRGRDPTLKPVALIGHMDVVAARREDWTRDPFVPVEEGGSIFARGAEDNKYDVAMMVATMARLKRDNYVPRRTIVLLLSGDEETAMTTGQALARQYRDIALLLNGDGGGGVLDDAGRPLMYQLQAGEKSYADFQVALDDPGGHSSAPTPGNPIYRLARDLDRLAAYRFPPQINALTKAWLEATGRRIGGEEGAAMVRYAQNQDSAAADLLSARPHWVGQIRTTCVATQVTGGHAANALPQSAIATINCRIFPGVTVAAVQDRITQVLADPSARITEIGEPISSDASPLGPEILAAVTHAVQARYPGLPVVPTMTAGASDSLFFRAEGIPSYGVGTLFERDSDSYAHGLNERVRADGVPASLAQWHSLLVELTR
jgi:carboxypeptidase PM20D1